MESQSDVVQPRLDLDYIWSPTFTCLHFPCPCIDLHNRGVGSRPEVPLGIRSPA